MQVYVSSAVAAAGLQAIALLRDSRPFQSSVLGESIMLKNVKCARCVKCDREYGRAQPHQLQCGGAPRHHLRLHDYIKANLARKSSQNPPSEHDVALPRAAARGGDHADTPLRVGWNLLYGEDRLAEAPRPQAVGEGRRPGTPPRPSKDRASIWRSLRTKAGAGDHRLLVHGQRGLVAGRQRRRRGSQDLHLRSLPRPPKGKGRAMMTFGANVISVQGQL